MPLPETPKCKKEHPKCENARAEVHGTKVQEDHTYKRKRSNADIFSKTQPKRKTQTQSTRTERKRNQLLAFDSELSKW